MIISVWPTTANYSLLGEEAEATVNHAWQAEMLARESARRYRMHYAVCVSDGTEPARATQVYTPKGTCLRP